MYKKRLISKRLEALSRLFPAILVTGPRQTGKSTLCRHFFPNHRSILLDDESILNLAQNDPGLFIQNFPPPVIYDEVQRASQLFLSLKSWIDQNASRETPQFILTGSQPFAVMKSVSDSLAGRIGIIELLPMTYQEVHGKVDQSLSFMDLIENKIQLGRTFPLDFPIQDILFRGGFPQMAIAAYSPAQEDVSTRLSNYVKTYLHRDLRDLSLVKDLPSFERFLRRFALTSATIKGPSDLASDLSIPRSTVQSWCGLLQASYISFEIPSYSKKLGRREKKASKFHLVDSGLMSNLLGYISPNQVIRSPLLGQIFETYALQVFRCWLQQQAVTPILYHWRLDEQREVDLVLEYGTDQLLAIEFKMSSNPRGNDLRGIKEFKKHYPQCQMGIVVSCLDRLMYLEPGILNIPISAF